MTGLYLRILRMGLFSYNWNYFGLLGMQFLRVIVNNLGILHALTLLHSEWPKLNVQSAIGLNKFLLEMSPYSAPVQTQKLL